MNEGSWPFNSHADRQAVFIPLSSHESHMTEHCRLIRPAAWKVLEDYHRTITCISCYCSPNHSKYFIRKWTKMDVSLPTALPRSLLGPSSETITSKTPRKLFEECCCFPVPNEPVCSMTPRLKGIINYARKALNSASYQLWQIYLGWCGLRWTHRGPGCSSARSLARHTPDSIWAAAPWAFLLYPSAFWFTRYPCRRKNHPIRMDWWGHGQTVHVWPTADGNVWGTERTAKESKKRVAKTKKERQRLAEDKCRSRTCVSVCETPSI